jgi:hypothetical protein
MGELNGARWVRVDQVPDYHPGLTVRILRDWRTQAKSGNLDGFEGVMSQVGRRIFVDLHALDRWMTEQTRGNDH